MMISREFDESNKERKERLYKARFATAEKLNRRIKHFFKDIDNNHSLNAKQKRALREQVLDNLLV